MKLKLYLIHSNNREDTVYMKGDIFFKNSHNIKIALLVDIHRGYFFLFSLSNAEQILSSDTFSLSGENRGDIFFIVKLNGLDTVFSK
jgi:hypothetical protein